MDLNQYLELFIDEAKEHLQSLNDQLLSLEQTPTDLDVIQVIFRSAHTLKGMSATMGFESMAHVTHEMENALDLLRTSQLEVTPAGMDTLFRCLDILEAMVAAITQAGNDTQVEVSDVLSDLRAWVAGNRTSAFVEENQGGAVAISHEQLDVLHLNDYERTVADQAIQTGFKVFAIRVTLSSECVLRAARAFMVVTTCDSLGDIIKAIPSVEDLEQEKFNHTFQLLVVSGESDDVIRDTLGAVSEVSDVLIVPLGRESLVTHGLDSQENPSLAEAAPTRESSVVLPRPAPAGAQPVSRSESLPSRPSTGSRTIRVEASRLDHLMNLLSELVIDRTRLESISRKLQNTMLQETVEHISRTSTELQAIVMAIRMVPVDTVFNRFPRMVRDLARDLGKQVDFVLTGGETEMDRTVIDEIGDPIVHLLRNAMDHGLEMPDERRQAGKSEIGQLELRAYHSGNQVFIEVTEDGRGVDREKVLARAIERNIVSPQLASQLTDEQVHALLFHSGFSTAQTVSDLSGRGVGLDVVKSKIEAIGGSIRLESNPGKGTRFSIQLPLTLSIIDAMLVVVAGSTLAIPLGSLMETSFITSSDIRYVHRQPVLEYRGKLATIVSLRHFFGFSSSPFEILPEQVYKAVIIRNGDQLVAAIVEDFVGQQEIVLKSLGKYLGDVHAISGATILGDGRVALVLDPNGLI